MRVDIETLGKEFFPHFLPHYQRLAVGAVLKNPRRERKPMIKGQAVIWGAREAKPLVNVPADAQRVRLRLRNDDLARAFVRYADRVEHWVLQPADGTLACPEWKLGALQGVNYGKPMLAVEAA